MSVLGEFRKAGNAAGGVVSGGAARAAKLSQMEIRRVKLRWLRKNVVKAEQELGALAYDLAQAGELSHPMLSASQARIGDARAAVSAMEAEIAALKDEAMHGDEPPEEGAEMAAVQPLPDADTDAEVSKSDDARAF